MKQNVYIAKEDSAFSTSSIPLINEWNGMDEVEKVTSNDIMLFVCCDVGIIRFNLCCICTF